MARDANGRFLPGSSGNPTGRRKRKKDYMALLDAACTPTKWKAIVNRAIEDAIGGDRWAREWVSSYLLGKPQRQVKIKGQVGLSLADWESRAAERIKEWASD